MDHDTIMESWQKNAEAREDRNFRFLRSLKFKDPDKVDRRAQRAHEEVFSIIDCTRCANCCRTTKTAFNNEDISRIAGYLEMSIEAFIDTYLEPVPSPIDPEDGAYAGRGLPCPLLAEDGRCRVYEVRPKACREYPHTDKKGFASRTYGHLGNSLVCPAVFEIIETIKPQGRC